MKIIIFILATTLILSSSVYCDQIERTPFPGGVTYTLYSTDGNIYKATRMTSGFFCGSYWATKKSANNGLLSNMNNPALVYAKIEYFFNNNIFPIYEPAPQYSSMFPGIVSSVNGERGGCKRLLNQHK